MKTLIILTTLTFFACGEATQKQLEQQDSKPIAPEVNHTTECPKTTCQTLACEDICEVTNQNCLVFCSLLKSECL